MDRFTALKTFCAVVETKSFTRAAKDTGLSRSAVSKNIRELEEHLGSTLIRRTTRGVGVTEIGMEYYARVHRLLIELHGADDAARQSNCTPNGNLRVAVPMTLGLIYIAPLIPIFLQRYPDISVELILSDSKVDLMADGFDMAIRASGKLIDSSVIARVIGTVNYVVCASPSYLERVVAPASPADLRRHDVLSFVSTQEPERWHFVKDGEESSVQVCGRYRSNNSLALRHMALAGQGVMRTPEIYVREDIKRGALVQVLENWQITPLKIWIMYPQSAFVPHRLRVFIDFMVDMLRDKDRRSLEPVAALIPVVDRAGLSDDPAGELALPDW